MRISTGRGGVAVAVGVHNQLLDFPLAASQWGDASSSEKPDVIWAQFIGQTHMLQFNGDSFESLRCSDGERVQGSLA